MIRHTITVFAIIFFMVSCETKNKESIMDNYDEAVISTKFGDGQCWDRLPYMGI